MAGFVEATAEAAGVTDPALQMTIGVSDGNRLYAVRHASGAEVNTLFVSEDARRCGCCIRKARGRESLFKSDSPNSDARVSK
jgi:hypothetical protein